MNEPLQPTLWRTCRALASHQRLRLLQVLDKGGSMTVSQVADEVGRPVNAVSENLRVLNARGLLRVRRRGRYVYYRVGADTSVPGAAELLGAVMSALGAGRDGRASVFRVLTGVTHYRRHQILYELHQRRCTYGELIQRSKIPSPALRRHLRKLRARGLIELEDRVYRVSQCRDSLRRTLLKLTSRPPA